MGHNKDKDPPGEGGPNNNNGPPLPQVYYYFPSTLYDMWSALPQDEELKILMLPLSLIWLLWYRPQKLGQ